MKVKITKYNNKICCCSTDFYIFWIDILNQVYDIDFYLDEEREFYLHEMLVKITISKIDKSYKVNFKIRGIKFNFEILEEEIGNWNNINITYY